MPSQDEIDQHQQDVEELSALAVAAVTAIVLAASHDGEDPPSLVKAIASALEPFLVAATELAVDWYRSLARPTPQPPTPRPGSPAPIVGPTDRLALLDAADFVPRPAELPPPEQIESTVWWALSATEQTPAPGEPPAPDATVPDQSVEPAVRPSEPAVRRPGTSPSEPPTPQVAPQEEIARARVVAAVEGQPRARVVESSGSQRQAIVVPATPEQQAAVISRLSGATQRYVTTAARDTITENAEREQVRWVREAKADACAFCRMLATRGTTSGDAGYLSKQSAQFVVGRRGRERGSRKIGELYHDFCQCEPVAVRAGDSYTPSEELLGWQEQYEKAVAAVGHSGNTIAILAAMRAAERESGGSPR